MKRTILKYIGLTLLVVMLWGYKDYILKVCILAILIPVRIGMTFGSTEDFGNGYELYTDDRCIYGQKGGLTIDIPFEVLGYESNGSFIVVRQQPDKYGSRGSYPYGRDTTYYWIIDKDNDRIYGPVLYDRFRQLGDSLDIRLKMARPDVKLTLSERLSNIFLYPHDERIPLD